MAVYKYQNNEFFSFYNANDKGKNASDCVARAISVALSQSWETTIREMTELGIDLGRTFNETKTIDAYLKKNGFNKMKEPRKASGQKMTLREFIRANPGFTALVKVGSHHIILVYQGKVIDTWDSSLETMHSYWVAPPEKPIVLNIEIPKRRFTL